MTPNNKAPIKEVTTGEQIYLTWRTFLKFALSPKPLSVTSSKFPWFTVGTFKIPGFISTLQVPKQYRVVDVIFLFEQFCLANNITNVVIGFLMIAFWKLPIKRTPKVKKKKIPPYVQKVAQNSKKLVLQNVISFEWNMEP